MLVRSLILLVPSLMLAACSAVSSSPQSEEPPPFEVALTPDVVFSPDGWPQTLRADIHYPQGEGERPGVLLVHGGGWEGRSRSDMSGTADRLAKAGYVVMNVDHRFAPEHRFPAQFHDVQVAMRWFQEQASELGVDPERIGAWGFSSGAHLVALLAVSAGQEEALDEPYGGGELAPKAVVAGGLPADFMLFDSGRRLIQLLGGTQEELPEAYRQASPITHVHSDAPPFFLFHGTWDRLVPIEHAEQFRQALDGVGVDSAFHRQSLRGHFLGFLFSGAATREGIEFLDARLAEPGKRR